MQSCIVVYRELFWLYKVIHLQRFIYLFIFPRQSSHQCSGILSPSFIKSFIQPRPPAGIRDDNSGAFRQLLLHCNSHNITETVHFIQPSLLCPAVTQCICLPTFSCWDLRLLCLLVQFPCTRTK